ncbi:MAG TPA: chloride channel protein [Polyangiaceae bacterium]|nr:chloride channel protein [Polyangiaceae bacterium]
MAENSSGERGRAGDELPAVPQSGRLPVAPSLEPTLEAARVPEVEAILGPRAVWISALAVGIAFAAGVIARVLIALIALVTNVAFRGVVSLAPAAPADSRFGAGVVLVPVVGGVLVGIMARYGSRAIRGHGIPEAMEQVLTNESRIPARLTFLKPLSAAIAIGTGGPFGAEGPIIATGGALGSLVGQVLETTSAERKTLLAAGAAAGMAAVFGSPVSAVLLAVELLLFEFRARSLVPVALASATAAGVRMAWVGDAPAFGMPLLSQPSGYALAFYGVLGAFFGVVAVGVTRAVYAIEDTFERLPIHWMWWPALGGLVVGVVGYVSPHTLGVGYDNIEHILSGALVGRALFSLCVLKFVSWSIALGSGTSGGTLAPLFTIGGGLGAAIGAVTAAALPALGVDARIAGLVGMAAIFAGASRALLASIVFAFETTLQPLGLLPLLGGCTAAYLVSCVMMRHTIMTEKIARRGVRVPSDYAADFLDRIWVAAVATRTVTALSADDTVNAARAWLAASLPETRHHAFPVLAADGALLGVVTRHQIVEAPGDARVRTLLTRPPAVAFDDSSLREAADLMVREGVGRLPVVTRKEPRKVVGMLTRSDLLSAHARRLDENERLQRPIAVPFVRLLGRVSRSTSAVD